MYDSFNFEELQKMAQDDPDRLEQLRIQWCENLIHEAPRHYRRKLRGLQFRIDMERRKARSPMAACISLSSMMHNSFDRLRDALNEASDEDGINTPSIVKDVENQEPAQQATVLPFRRA